MNTVDLVKKICKERKIPISQLERECGFSNGYIRGLTKGKFPSTRLQTIADYLDLPISYLLGQTQTKEYYTDETYEIAYVLLIFDAFMRSEAISFTNLLLTAKSILFMNYFQFLFDRPN